MAVPENRVSQDPVSLGTGDLTIEEVVDVARWGRTVALLDGGSGDPRSREAHEAVVESRKWVDETVASNEDPNTRITVYGINTGFGSKAGRTPLLNKDVPWVSRNLILSHSAGLGPLLDLEVVRAAMLIRANSLSQGFSGVRPEVINTLVEMLNRGVIPAVPSYGSVGACGDLAPLSHLALVMSKRPKGHGDVPSVPADYVDSGQAYLEIRSAEDATLEFESVIVVDGRRFGLTDGAKAMQTRGIDRIVLLAKEGLALNNGATFSVAMAALAVFDAENVARHSEVTAAMSVDALLGFRDAFLPEVQKARRHRGQVEVAERVLKFLTGSTLADGDAATNTRVVPPQDAYSTRATPPVTGSVWESLRFIRETVSNELNAATDNPLIFVSLPSTRTYKSVSGSNFHGAPVAHVLDYLAILMTDLASLCERRLFRLTDGSLNEELPAMLVDDPEDKPGLMSGMMIAQYLAAGIVSDCKTLAHPDSVDSIPTCANQEDHVSMSMNAARHARTVVANAERVAGIELLCAFLALEGRVNQMNERLADREKARKEIADRRKKGEHHLKRQDSLFEAIDSGAVVGIKVGIGTGAAIASIRSTLHGRVGALPEWRVPKGGVADPAGQSS